MSAADGTSVQERTDKLEGLGCKRKRVEDARFTQGKGNYVDDMKLPGMVFGRVLRPAEFNASLNTLDTKAADAMPGVKVVRDGDLSA